MEQLKQLANKNYFFDVIFTSPTKRTLKTACVFKNSNNLIICDGRILERDFGNLESKEVQEGEKEILSNRERDARHQYYEKTISKSEYISLMIEIDNDRQDMELTYYSKV